MTCNCLAWRISLQYRGEHIEKISLRSVDTAKSLELPFKKWMHTIAQFLPWQYLRLGSIKQCHSWLLHQLQNILSQQKLSWALYSDWNWWWCCLPLPPLWITGIAHNKEKNSMPVQVWTRLYGVVPHSYYMVEHLMFSDISLMWQEWSFRTSHVGQLLAMVLSVIRKKEKRRKRGPKRRTAKLC